MIIVTKHCLHKYYLHCGQKISKQKLEDDKEKQKIITILNAAREIDIPPKFKIRSLINNEFEPAKYFYHEIEGIVLVVIQSANNTVIKTCYRYDDRKIKGEEDNPKPLYIPIPKTKRKRAKLQHVEARVCPKCDTKVRITKYEQHIKDCG